MTAHRSDIQLFLKVAKDHEGNELIDTKLEAFWTSYDELVVALKMVDDGEIKSLQNRDSQLNDALRQYLHVGKHYPWFKDTGLQAGK